MYVLQPDQFQTLRDGTQAGNVSIYKVSLVSNDKNQDGSMSDAFTYTTKQIAEGYGMTYSESASDEIIPALPIFGMANTEPFKDKTVVIAQRNSGKWWLEISDYAFDPKHSPGIARYDHSDLQSIHISLPAEPAVGSKFEKTMSYGGGYFQIKKSPSSKETTSWNTSIAYYIEVDSWNKEETVRESCGIPSLGTASGKLYISFKGSFVENGHASSWVSGQFRDVPIVY